MRILLPFLFFFIVSCSDNNKYEYILKEDYYKYNFKLNKEQSFVDLEEGFTFYNAVNQNSKKIPVVLIHGFSVPSYIWSPTYKMLKEKGKLIVAVPNFKSYDAEYYKEYWAAYDVPRHLWHFSQNSIHTLFESVEMNVVKIHPLKYDSFYVSLLSEKHKTGKSNYLKAF